MGNFLNTNKSSFKFKKQEEIDKLLQSSQNLIIVTPKQKLLDCSDACCDLFGVETRDDILDLKNVLGLSEAYQQLYSSKAKESISQIIEKLSHDLSLDFFWEIKTKDKKKKWVTVKLDPIRLKENKKKKKRILINLIKIKEPTKILKKVREMEELTKIVKFLNNQENYENEEELNKIVELMEQISQKKTQENSELKNQFSREKKEFQKLKKEIKNKNKIISKQKQKEEKEQKKKKKEKQKNKNRNPKDPKKDKINDPVGDKKVQELKHEVKKLKFQLKKMESQDKNQTFLRNLSILKNKHKIQKRENKELHQLIEKEDVLKKELNEKLNQLNQQIEEIGNSSEFKKENKKIKKLNKKIEELEKESNTTKQKIKNSKVDKELQKELDIIRSDLSKKKKINNDLRLQINSLKNRSNPRFPKSESEISEISETSEFGSDYNSEDDSSRFASLKKTDNKKGINDKEGNNSQNNNNNEKEKENNNQNKKEKKGNEDQRVSQRVKSNQGQRESNLGNAAEWIKEKRKPTFQEIFQHQIGFEYYKEFLSYQYNVEQLLFYFEVENFKEYYIRVQKKIEDEKNNIKKNSSQDIDSSGTESTTDNEKENETEEDEDRLQMKYKFRYLNTWVFEIIKLFIKPDSIFELDLDLEMRTQIIQNAIQNTNINIFDQVQKKVYYELSGDIFLNFQNSPLFSDLIEHCQGLDNNNKTQKMQVRKGTFVYTERLLDTLNSCINYEGDEIKNPFKLAESLMESLIDMLNGSYSISNEQIDCEKLRQSIPFRRFEFATCKLQSVSLQKIKNENYSKKFSFMINLYNIIALYSMIMNGHPYDSSSYRKFLNESMFNLGGQSISLINIRNLILPPSSSVEKRFNGPMTPINAKDPKVYLALIDVEGIIPLVKVFYHDKLSNQLRASSREFLKRNVRIKKGTKNLLVPRLFKKHSKDFGSSEREIRKWIWKHSSLQEEAQNYTLKVIKDVEFNGVICFTPEYDFED
ncbi:electron carrier/ protein disulfide oxidoreductase [Anaeramoeba flamelloides]|uniref:Electron carrier/ protein disulfide oxidoreductase n=1 Tax=Anaeramoeba flamelloides TaxID=1746091 RepID=A0AAV7Z066_9EUKA|nr:electron carrier/ protein disulfide oxidoreductase [Anaeramoeba flamelloides]